MKIEKSKRKNQKRKKRKTKNGKEKMKTRIEKQKNDKLEMIKKPQNNHTEGTNQKERIKN